MSGSWAGIWMDLCIDESEKEPDNTYWQSSGKQEASEALLTATLRSLVIQDFKKVILV